MRLNPDHFVIFGSMPMFAHGLHSRICDLDVVARGEVLSQVSIKGQPAMGGCTGDTVWTFLEGHIQFSERWITAEWDTNSLIENAEIVDGLRLAPLEEVLRYKEELRRQKDEVDIKALKSHLGHAKILVA